MRIQVEKHNLVIITPDNDSDRALLGMLASMTPRLASSTYSCDSSQTVSVCIEFNALALNTAPNRPISAVGTDGESDESAGRVTQTVITDIRSSNEN